MANSIVTTKARSNMVKARAGVIQLPVIQGMAFGDGGTDYSGEPIMPGTDALYNELFRKEIDCFKEITETCYRYTCTLLKPDMADKTINEIGLYDAAGDMVALKTFKNKAKDSDMEMVFEIDDQF